MFPSLISHEINHMNVEATPGIEPGCTDLQSAA